MTGGLNTTRLAHIINPVRMPPTSDLHVAQPITFAAMRHAREVARGRVDVTQLTTQYQEDHSVVPPDFDRTPDLDRSVLDLGDFKSRRKLPLLKDILSRAYEDSDARYLIYTNVDIGLMPHFYLAVNRLIEDGFDAIVINRRTVPAVYRRVEDLPLIWTELGEDHPGHDCFVFRREVIDRIDVGNVCLGARFVMRPLIWHVAGLAGKFIELGRPHLTFHLGNDRVWLSEENAEFTNHNFREAERVFARLESDGAFFRPESAAYPYLIKFQRYLRRYQQVGRHHRRGDDGSHGSRENRPRVGRLRREARRVARQWSAGSRLT
jgi:hypothetical protein